jgi:hypothetical protein
LERKRWNTYLPPIIGYVNCTSDIFAKDCNARSAFGIVNGNWLDEIRLYDGSRHSMVAPSSIAERRRRQYQEQQNRGESA